MNNTAMDLEWGLPNSSVANKVIPMFYVYTFEGLVLFLFNGSIAFCIARHGVLRQRYTVQLAQITVDAIMGLALLSAGFGRLLIASWELPLRTRQFCALMPWNLLSVWSEPMSAVCLLMVSIDRLFALLAPIPYFRKNQVFQNVQVTSWSLFVWAITSASWYFTFSSEKIKVSPFCWTRDSLIPTFGSILLGISISASVLSVVLYVVVFFISRKHATRVREMQTTEQAMLAFTQRQRQLTVTMGVSCIFTLILYVLPLVLKFILNSSLPTHHSNVLSTYAAVSVDLNPLSNTIVILLRHDDIGERYVAMMPSFLRSPIQRYRQSTSSKMSTALTTQKTALSHARSIRM